MIVFSTLILTSLVTVTLSSAPACKQSNDQCASSPVSTTLACTDAATCCAANCALVCNDCTSLTISGSSAVGSSFTVNGDDNAMAVVIDGAGAANGATISGEGFRSFTCSASEGFQNGVLNSLPSNEDVGNTVLCSAANCCNSAAMDVRFAASFTANAADAAFNTQFRTLRPLNNAFTINCVAGGACESADFKIVIDDCQGFDPWIVPTIQCVGVDACQGASFTFENNDPACTLQLNQFICNGQEACQNVRVYTTGVGPTNLVPAACTCTGTNACTGAGSVPAGFCTGFDSTFSPTTAPVPTKSPTPCPTDTAAPTTAAPTTAAPTTAAPTTAAPTTAAPTTAAPTTAAPTSAAPTTAAPTSAAPTTAAPTASVATGDDDDDDDSASGSGSSELAELEEVLDELNAAHANVEENNDEETNDLFGEDNDNDKDEDNDEVTNYEMVISLSYEALEHLWAIVITFVVFNGICLWCYYNRFGAKKKRYGDSLPSAV